MFDISHAELQYMGGLLPVPPSQNLNFLFTDVTKEAEWFGVQRISGCRFRRPLLIHPGSCVPTSQSYLAVR